MDCPICGHGMKNEICGNCGSNATLIKRVCDISDAFYNKGLKQATERDMSGAMASLSKSLHFNKRNKNARNLLGLVYLEAGRIGDALYSFVLSINLNKQDNAAEEYLNRIQKNTSVMDGLNRSVQMYNQALVYMEQKSEDMAQIHLKKAVEINPDFIEALNLLALCYLIQDEPRKAAQCADKVIALDCQNTTALKLIHKVGASKGVAHGSASADSRKDNSNKRKSMPVAASFNADKKSGVSMLSCVLLIFLGAAVSFILFYFVVMPSNLGPKDKAYTDKVAELTTLQSKYNTDVADLKQQNSDLTAELDISKAEAEDLRSDAGASSKNREVLAAILSYYDGDYEAVANSPFTGGVSGVEPEYVERYNTALNESKKKLEESYYNEGRKLYDTKNYPDSIENLIKAISYTTPDSELIDDCYYILGRAYQFSADIDNARLYLTKVVDEYPDSNWFATARQRLNELK